MALQCITCAIVCACALGSSKSLIWISVELTNITNRMVWVSRTISLIVSLLILCSIHIWLLTHSLTAADRRSISRTINSDTYTHIHRRSIEGLNNRTHSCNPSDCNKTERHYVERKKAVFTFPSLGTWSHDEAMCVIFHFMIDVRRLIVSFRSLQFLLLIAHAHSLNFIIFCFLLGFGSMRVYETVDRCVPSVLRCVSLSDRNNVVPFFMFTYYMEMHALTNECYYYVSDSLLVLWFLDFAFRITDCGNN